MIKILYIALILCVSGCARNIEHQPAVVKSPGYIFTNGDYRIGPHDILEINIYQEDDLPKMSRVSAEGFISLPLIGQVEVGGLTVAEVGCKITKLLKKDYMYNPQVTIFVKEYSLKKISILGAIRSPGSYKIPQERPLTVLEAISLAGGFSKDAAKNKIRILRVEHGIEKNIEVDVKKITKKGDRKKDIILKANDIIFIPERLF